MRILILCTGNSCRSQMAQGFLRNIDDSIIVESAGTKPEGYVNPRAIDAMYEIGIDISEHTSDHIDRYLELEWDYVITVCDSAKETCPIFPGKVKNHLHIGFDDPFGAQGTQEEIKNEFRCVRDEIKEAFTAFYHREIKC